MCFHGSRNLCLESDIFKIHCFFELLSSFLAGRSSETFAPPKVSNTSKGGLRRGEEKEVVAALLLFPPP